MKGFTKKQVLEAIENCEFTYKSVAKYLSQFAPNGKCDDKTAKAYIEKYGDDTKNAFKNSSLELIDLAVENIIFALKRRDVKTSKWVLERISRETFGNEITVNTENQNPLNINFEGLSKEDLLKASNIEINYGNEEKETASE